MPVKPAEASGSKNNHGERHQNDLEIEDEKLQAGKTAIYDKVWLELNKKNDKKLLDVLAIPPTNNRRDANGDINKPEDIFRYVPSNFEDGSKVPYHLAKTILRDATIAAVSYRINEKNIGGGFRYAQFSDTPKDGYQQIIVRWLFKEPEIPDYIKNYPGIVSLALG